MSEHALFESNGKGLNDSHVLIPQAPAHACLFAMANTVTKTVMAMTIPCAEYWRCLQHLFNYCRCAI